MGMRIEIEINGRARDVTVERDPVRPERVRVSWDGTTREVDARIVERDRSGMLLSLVEVGEAAASRQVRCVSTGRNGLTELHLGGAVVEAVVNGRRLTGDSPGDAGGGASRLTAPMPGKVVRVLVAPGDQVEARQPLIVVEAMKMENELGAPRAGTVAEVPVTEGMSVEAGRLLAAIE
jgi:biotin carboxyl carrier protein